MVNQLINWRMCKKKQMRWSKAGAHNLVQVKTAAITGQLQQFVALTLSLGLRDSNLPQLFYGLFPNWSRILDLPWYKIDRRLDLLINLQLAAAIPVVDASN